MYPYSPERLPAHAGSQSKNILIGVEIIMLKTALARVAVFSALFSCVSPASFAGSLPPNISVPTNATVYSNIQEKSSWQTCIGSCANGPIPKSYSMTRYYNGTTAAAFHESGTTFGDVLWYNALGSTTATHFILDAYIKVDHPENIQALEIAVLKRSGYSWHKFSTQCNYNSGELRGYDPVSHHWVSLGANCVRAVANTWQRITLQFNVSGGTTNFVGASFDGNLQPIVSSLPPLKYSATSESLGIHFQMDNGDTNSGATVLVDKWKVYAW